jgi:hypothetical protein
MAVSDTISHSEASFPDATFRAACAQVIRAYGAAGVAL